MTLSRLPVLVAWTCAAASFGIVTVTIVLILLSPGETYVGSAFGDAVFLASFVAFAVVGALIATRHRRSPIAWIFCGIGLLMATDLLVGRLLLVTRHAGGELSPVGLWVYNWLWAPPTVALLTFLPLLFPDGQLPGRRWRPALAAAWVAIIAVTAAFMAGPTMTEPFSDRTNPFVLPALANNGPAVEAASSGLWGVATITSVAALAVRFRRSRGIERQQLKWFAWALALVAVVVMPYAAITVSFGERVAVLVLGIALPGVLAAVPLTAGIAIFRYRLYEIDLIINRTAVYVPLTVALALSYVAFVVLLQAALRPLTGGSEIAVAGSTLAVVALVQPMRRRIQEIVDRRFYRSRYDAARTLDGFAARMRDQVDIDAVRGEVLDVVGATVRPAHASVWLRQVRQ